MARGARLIRGLGRLSGAARMRGVEEELRASRDRLRLALDAAGMGVWDWDLADGGLLWWGDLERVHGMAPGSFDGTFERFLAAVHADDRAAVQERIGRTLTTGEPFSAEFRAVGDDGRVRWVSTEGTAVFDRAGRPRRMLGVARDVTDVRRADAALRESEDRFRRMADHAPVLIWVSDPSGARTWLNAEWLRHTGRSMEQELGDGWAENVHPDDLERRLRASRRAIERRQAFEIEYRLRRADGSYGWVLDRAVPRIGRDGDFAGLIGSCVDITARLEHERRGELLAEIGVVLNGPMALEGRLDGLVRTVLPAVADSCVVDLITGPGRLVRAAAAHVDPERSRVLADLPPPLEDSPIGEVAATGRPMLLPDVSDELTERYSRGPADAQARARLRVRSAVVAPLVARGRRIGVLSLSTSRDHSDRRLTEDDLGLAEEIAERVALAVDNARLYESEHELRRQMEFLLEAGALLSSSLDHEATLRALAALVVPDLADWCAVHLRSESGGLTPVAIAHADPERERWASELAARHPGDPDALAGPSAVVRTGEPQLVEQVTDELLVAAARDEQHLGVLREMGLTSYVCVPLAVRGRPIGALSLLATRESGRRFGPADLRLARQLAERAAVAIDNARLFRAQQRIADTLQQALLPAELPVVPGAALGAAYLPMGTGVEAGGDFYDVVRSEDGRWLVVIGDVCGKGPEAASLTALARYTIRALAQHDPCPARLLAQLNDAVLHQRPGSTQFLTACAGLVERAGAGLRVTLASAGHPPPLVLRASGATEWVRASGPLVGIRRSIRPAPAEVALEPGDRLLLYTDGLTEARTGRGRFLGEEGLAAVAAEIADAPAAELAGRVADRVREMCGGRLHDDVAVLVVGAAAARAARGDGVPARADDAAGHG
ncbi:SpoIIE family protein phosphatase [Miltoncostaea marina]|uniref:SpoIIE family protein phosphatase n=1 Tax=Miltoncostaea marina TaxID=2843215 RepID=UPI001C3E075C|nr:SpoIIE family protein phosphatase [Miltoncostaea marina]